MCQTIHVDDVFDAILDDREDHLEVDDPTHAEVIAEDIPAPPETHDETFLDFVHAVEYAVIREGDLAALQAVRDDLLTSG